jgi:hypothetical protein
VSSSRPSAVHFCSHWDLATVDTLTHYRQEAAKLEPTVGEIPEQMLPFWSGKDELMELCLERSVKFLKSDTVATLEGKLRTFCDCASVRGSPSAAGRINKVPTTTVFRDACHWAKANKEPRPTKPSSDEEREELRAALKKRLTDAEILILFRRGIAYFERFDDADLASQVSKSGHIVDPRKFVDCGMQLTKCVVCHVLRMLYELPLSMPSMTSTEIGERFFNSSEAVREVTKMASFGPSKKSGDDSTPWRLGTAVDTFVMKGSQAINMARGRVNGEEDPATAPTTPVARRGSPDGPRRQPT